MLSNIKTSKFFIRTEIGIAGKPELTLFDESGNQTTPPKQLLSSHFDNLIAAFNGGPKAVKRSSGGLINVAPSQLVLVNTDEQLEEIRVKVLFRELERNAQHQIISKKVVLSSKAVLLSEIQEGFTYDNIRTQNFVLDVGLGIIPVHVLSFYLDHQGLPWAIFVRYDQMEKAIIESTSTRISVFEVPQSLLRWIKPLSGTDEKDFQWAKNHVQKLLDRGEQIVPEVLLMGHPITTPSGLSFASLEHHLISTVQQTIELQVPSYFIPNSEAGTYEPLLLLNENPD